MFKFELGQKVRSMVSGFAGIVSGRTEWLSGCLRYNVRAQLTGKETEMKEPGDAYFDEGELELVNGDSVLKTKSKQERTGGPQRTEPQRVQSPPRN